MQHPWPLSWQSNIVSAQETNLNFTVHSPLLYQDIWKASSKAWREFWLWLRNTDYSWTHIWLVSWRLDKSIFFNFSNFRSHIIPFDTHISELGQSQQILNTLGRDFIHKQGWWQDVTTNVRHFQNLSITLEQNHLLPSDHEELERPCLRRWHLVQLFLSQSIVALVMRRSSWPGVHKFLRFDKSHPDWLRRKFLTVFCP